MNILTLGWKKFTIVIITLFLISSCTSQRRNICGSYNYTHNGFEYVLGVELKRDSSFEYFWQKGLERGTTEGKWSVSDRNIILNSYVQPPQKLFEVLETKKIAKEGIELLFVDKDSSLNRLINCMLITDKVTVKKWTDFTGYLQCTECGNNLKLLKAHSFNYFSFSYQPADSSNYFKISIKPDTLHRYFTSEKWRIRYRRLIAKEDSVKFVYKKSR